MTHDGPQYDYSGSDDEDPLILSPAMQQAIGPKAPVGLFNAVSVAMAALIEALELGIMPPDAMPIPGVPGAYLHPVPNDFGMIEYHDTQTPKGRPAYYLARIVSPEDFLNDF
ncbi:hypothetical protein AB5J55_44315 [Streptomyces sp. R11]|uniref:Uncharacterized protein n=1 Tax=Streptomyces sp. R11 TaxID=3238625 RepID=A0AB39NDK9_9ACTN